MSQPPDAQATYLVGEVGAGARVIVGSNITYVESRKPPPEIRFGPPGDLPDFVDRDEPLAMLRDRASAALKGASPTSVLLNVVGFPGVGKSALGLEKMAADGNCAVRDSKNPTGHTLRFITAALVRLHDRNPYRRIRLTLTRETVPPVRLAGGTVVFWSSNLLDAAALDQ